MVFSSKCICHGAKLLGSNTEEAVSQADASTLAVSWNQRQKITKTLINNAI